MTTHETVPFPPGDVSNADLSHIASELSASFAHAWNEHDIDTLAGLFHQDAAFVNVRGGYLTNRSPPQTAPGRKR